MKRRILLAASVTAVAAAAAALRLPALDARPMHADEAVQAVKFGRLIERGEYRYDPDEFHGPTLNYLTLPAARAADATSLAELSETNLRLTPAVLGIVLAAATFLLARGLGLPAAVYAALLAAVSPAMVFYSRYYIHETLLVFFTFGAVVAFWWAVRGRGLLAKAVWAALAGLFVGLMHATKETCVIHFLAMAAAGISLAAWQRPKGGYAVRRKLPALAAAAASVLVVAAGVSALLYSSFLTHARGPLDSIAALAGYVGRASGEGEAAGHVKPWHYYLTFLVGPRRPGSVIAGEGLIVLLALVGLGAAAAGKGLGRASVGLVRFIAVYTVVVLVVYSALPYKTPWSILGALHGMILLAGVGAAAMVRFMGPRILKVLPLIFLTLAAAYLGCQAWATSHVWPADPENLYAYAQTTRDVPALARLVDQIAAAHPQGRDMPVQVISPDGDYWPLPWYLRRLRRVGWYDKVPDDVAEAAAPVIICKPSVGPTLVEKLFAPTPPGQHGLYVDLSRRLTPGRDIMLRPGVPLRAYARLNRGR